MLKIKKATITGSFFGGRERIRTAVRAFAELCLATRPHDHFVFAKLWIIGSPPNKSRHK